MGRRRLFQTCCGGRGFAFFPGKMVFRFYMFFRIADSIDNIDILWELSPSSPA